MGITNKYKRIPLTAIVIKRDERQRREIDVTDLEDSVRRRGVVQPIIVEEQGDGQYLLVAGERRFTVSSKLGIPDIPARLTTDLTETERQILELEENVKRKELPWKNEVLAVSRIHSLYEQLSPDDWTQEKTATELGMGGGVLSIMLKVAEEVRKGTPSIVGATGYRSAYNIIARKEGRAIDDAMTDLLTGDPEPEPELVAEPEPEPTPTSGATPTAKPVSRPAAPAIPRIVPIRMPESILNVSFLEWAPKYRGLPFNLIHCDFPYGINFDKSDQGGSGKQWEGYEDSEKTYWDLCACLCRNIDTVMSQSAHLLFWLSSDIERQYETIDFFRRNSDLTVQTVPITWHKTDNKGILPDPKRQPRRVTETALLASRGDRLIIKAVSNAYGAPTSKEIHQSEKPEPVLRHFLQMFVDANTRMLDPTCGSGTALRAAESLGAPTTLGLEINPETVEAARIALRKFRALKAATTPKEA